MNLQCSITLGHVQLRRRSKIPREPLWAQHTLCDAHGCNSPWLWDIHTRHEDGIRQVWDEVNHVNVPLRETLLLVHSPLLHSALRYDVFGCEICILDHNLLRPHIRGRDCRRHGRAPQIPRRYHMLDFHLSGFLFLCLVTGMGESHCRMVLKGLRSNH